MHGTTSCRSTQKAAAAIGRLRRRHSRRHEGGTGGSIDAIGSPAREAVLPAKDGGRSKDVRAADGLQLRGYGDGAEQAAARADMLYRRGVVAVRQAGVVVLMM